MAGNRRNARFPHCAADKTTDLVDEESLRPNGGCLHIIEIGPDILHVRPLLRGAKEAVQPLLGGR